MDPISRPLQIPALGYVISHLVPSFVALGFLFVVLLSGCGTQSTTTPVPVVRPAPQSSESNLDQLLTEAEKAYEDNRLEAAKESLTRLLVLSPQHPAGLFLMARVEAETGNVEAAIGLLESISAEDPSFEIAAMGQRADYLSSLGRASEAIELWRRLLERNDSLDVVRDRLADDLYAAGRRIEAGRVLQDLVQRSAADTDHLRKLLRVTDWPKSREELMAASGSRTGFRGQVQDRMRPTTAVSVPESLSGASPTLAGVWELTHSRKYRDALEMVQSVLAKEKSDQAVALMALAQSDLQLFDELRRTLAEASPSIVRFPSYWIAVGNLWKFEGEPRKAVAAYARALLADPTWELPHEHLVGGLLAMGDVNAARQIDERKFMLAGPIEAYRAVGPNQPDDAQAARFLIEDLKNLGQVEQACSWLRSVAPRHPQRFGNTQQVQSLCNSWTRPNRETLNQRQLAGLDLSQFPDPARDLSQAGESRERSVASGASNDPIAVPILVDVAKEVGLEMTYFNLPVRKSRLLRLHESLGSGVAALDFDKDGAVDFYFGQASGDPPNQIGTRPNQLMRQVDGRFVEVTLGAGVDDRGYAVGVTAGDWNGDGWEDLVVGNLGSNRLFINQGDGTFADATERVGFGSATFTSSLGMADVDGDSLADLVEVNYADDPTVLDPIIVGANGIALNYPGPNRFRSGLDVVWLNSPTGQMQSVLLQQTASANFDEIARTADDPLADRQIPKIGDDSNPGLGLVITNLDDAKGLEVFVANDARPNQLWRVQRHDERVVLTQTAATSGLATSGQGKTTACMGVASGDFDQDGRLDLLVTNWFDEWVNLYLQRSPGLFQDLAPAYGLDRYSDHHLGFGVQALDYDNNGLLDLVIGNGHIDDFSHAGQPQRMPTQLLINRGNFFEEANMSATAGGYWLASHLGRCVMTCDYDRDGKIDAVVTDLEDPVALLHNQTDTENQFIQFQLVGTECERSAVGARVEVTAGDQILSETLAAGNGYLGRNEPLIHFGLAKHTGPLWVRVIWPDGATTDSMNVQANRRYLVIQNEEACFELAQ